MKIGIIGSGNVGGALGSRWAKLGHEVIFGTRNPQGLDVQQLSARASGKTSAATLADAARDGEVLLLATPWPATQQIVSGLGDVHGKILIDATNPLLPDLSGLTHGTTTSGGEQVASWAHGAKVVKAFNTVGANIMADPAFEGHKPVMFYCGDDAQAKQVVKKLIDELVFEAVDAGPLTQARLLEPFALLWISMALVHGLGRDFAFELLRRNPAKS
ncbi:MAG: NADPH-dependent F420 reductase [Bryobacteraceae bacterium]|jgi:predicted dinucleotide-binding enzyme